MLLVGCLCCIVPRASSIVILCPWEAGAEVSWSRTRKQPSNTCLADSFPHSHSVACMSVAAVAWLYPLLLLPPAGNWQWELHQRHQHLLRQVEAQGQDSAALQDTFDACLAAERERVAILQTMPDGQGGCDTQTHTMTLMLKEPC